MGETGSNRFGGSGGVRMAALMLGLSFAACSRARSNSGAAAPAAPAAPVTLDASGGTVAGPGGVSVIVPPGAATSPVAIQVTQDATGAPAAPDGVKMVAPVVTITPHRTKFDVPVTITIPFDASKVAEGDRLVVMKAEPDEGWVVLDSFARTGNAVQVAVTDFSLFAVGVASPLILQFSPPNLTAQIDFSHGFDRPSRAIWAPGLGRPAIFPVTATVSGTAVCPQGEVAKLRGHIEAPGDWQTSTPTYEIEAGEWDLGPAGVTRMYVPSTLDRLSFWNQTGVLPPNPAGRLCTTLFLSVEIFCPRSESVLASAPVAADFYCHDMHTLGTGLGPDDLATPLGARPSWSVTVIGGALGFAIGVPTTPQQLRDKPYEVEWQQSGDDGSSWRTVALGLEYDAPLDSHLRRAFSVHRSSFTGPPATLEDDGTLVRALVCFDRPDGERDCTVSRYARLTVTSDTPPVFTTQPADVMVAAGAAATFTVAVAGTPAPAVHWQARGPGETTWLDIPGATSATYTTPAASPADDGTRFRAVATNAAGTAASDAALLEVNLVPVAPIILVHPFGLTVPAGAPATLAVVANGSAPLEYQWSKNLDPIPGETGAVLTLALTRPADTGSYTVTVSNGVSPPATSLPAWLEVVSPPTIGTEPASVSVMAGQPASFFVSATGTGLAYQWLRNGVAVAGAVDPTLTVPAAAPADSGAVFSVLVSNVAGTVLSGGAVLTVTTAPPTLVLTTTTLPGGTAGTPYAQALTASGGTPPFAWSVSAGAPPAGLFLDAAGGVLSGTPSAGGSSTFTVTVEDAATPPQAASRSFTVAVQASGGSRTLLDGLFVLKLAGFYRSSPAALLGVLVPDGAGGFFGEADINLGGGASLVSVTAIAGVGADGRGTLTLDAGAAGTFTFALAFGPAPSGAADTIHVVSADASGLRVSGVARRANPAMYLQNLAGDFALGVAGPSPGGQFAAAGRFSVDSAGAVTAGLLDVNDGGTLVRAAVAGAATIDSAGRGTLTLGGGAAPALDLVFYSVSPSELLLMSPGAARTSPLLVGTARRQLGGPFSGASLAVTSAILGQGGATSPGKSSAYVGTLTPSGSGLQVETVENDGGTVRTHLVEVAPSVEASGRVRFGSGEPVLYLTAPGQGFALGRLGFAQDARATLGWFEPRAPGPYGLGSFQGAYGFGSGPPVNADVPLLAGRIAADGAGALSSVADAMLPGGAIELQQASETYVEDSGWLEIGPSGRSWEVVVVSPIRAFALGGTSPTLAELDGAVAPAIATPRVAGGQGFAIALKADGTVWAWGGGAPGVLGQGPDGATWLAVPAPVKDASGTGTLSGVVSIAATTANVYAVTSSGTVWRWGTIENGTGQYYSYSLPVQVPGPGGDGVLTDIRSIWGGEYNVYAVDGNGTLWAMGSGNLGDGRFIGSGLPVQVVLDGTSTPLSGITAVAGSVGHTLARKADGTVWAWGQNNWAQLGNNDFEPRSGAIQVNWVAPAGVATPGNFLQLADSVLGVVMNSFAVLATGQVMSWGALDLPGLGWTPTEVGSNHVAHAIPDPAAPASDWRVDVPMGPCQASLGMSLIAVYVQKRDCTVWGFGYGSVSWDGIPVDSRAVPMLVGPLTTGVVSLGTSWDDTMYAIKGDGTVWNWVNTSPAPVPGFNVLK